MNPQFLDDLDVRLRRHGLPRRYVRRVVGELGDHYESLRHAHARAGRDDADARRLAQRQLAPDPQALVDAIVSRCPAGRGVVALARRHPIATFVLAPVPLMLAIGLALRFVGVLSYALVVDGLNVDNMHPALRAVVHNAFYGCAYGVTPALALLFCALAERANRPVMLALASCALLCVAGGMLKLDLVQCVASKHVAYFQRYGPDPLRLSLPLVVFVAHSVRRLALWRHPGRWQAAGG